MLRRAILVPHVELALREVCGRQWLHGTATVRGEIRALREAMRVGGAWVGMLSAHSTSSLMYGLMMPIFWASATSAFAWADIFGEAEGKARALYRYDGFVTIFLAWRYT